MELSVRITVKDGKISSEGYCDHVPTSSDFEFLSAGYDDIVARIIKQYNGSIFGNVPLRIEMTHKADEFKKIPTNK